MYKLLLYFLITSTIAHSMEHLKPLQCISSKHNHLIIYDTHNQAKNPPSWLLASEEPAAQAWRSKTLICDCTRYPMEIITKEYNYTAGERAWVYIPNFSTSPDKEGMFLLGINREDFAYIAIRNLLGILYLLKSSNEQIIYWNKTCWHLKNLLIQAQALNATAIPFAETHIYDLRHQQPILRDKTVADLTPEDIDHICQSQWIYASWLHDSSTQGALLLVNDNHHDEQYVYGFIQGFNQAKTDFSK